MSKIKVTTKNTNTGRTTVKTYNSTYHLDGSDEGQYYTKLRTQEGIKDTYKTPSSEITIKTEE